LEDRKFFYAVGAEESPWNSTGPERAVRMVPKSLYEGGQAPELTLHEGAEPAGLVQGNLALRKGKTYEGRILLAGAASAAPIEVSLVWGPREEDKQTIRIGEGAPAPLKFTPEYQKVRLNFTAGADTDTAQLSIVGRGSGAFRIGAVSLMPSDNVQGMRADTLALLKELDAPIYRWPGGNFVSGYDWQDGIGDPDLRPPRKNPAWRGIEHNDFGLDEFMAFCRELGTEPLIVVNSGLGGVDMAIEELQYTNGAADTPMGQWRADNGHEAPYGVTWWGIGNEMYGAWQLGHMPLEDYVKKHNAFADAMRAEDASIHLVAVGATGKWSETMLRECAGYMDALSEHFYVGEKPGLVSHVRQIPDSVRHKAVVHRHYHETIPALANKMIPIALDEWNYWYGPERYGEIGVRYYLRDALGIAAGLHEMTRHSDVFVMANYAQTVNVIGAIKTSQTDAVFATTGLVLKLYRREYGAIPVEVTGQMALLDVAAAWTQDRAALTVGIVNPTHTAYALPTTFEGVTLSGNGKRWLITADDYMAYNEPGKPMQVSIAEETVSGVADSLHVPPLCVCLYRLSTE
ncbi:MAG TPA: alpha-L-arabinofuranosidase, partial [Candidatus Hydrogenedentes bacterium]|nr:alpha-L-arabinofuranosidase [Candidatus Hydrogenedentota bacterium]